LKAGSTEKLKPASLKSLYLMINLEILIENKTHRKVATIIFEIALHDDQN
jgi:hypothetical protein